MTKTDDAPLNTVTMNALTREAVRRSGVQFGTANEHPALVARLVNLFKELRSLGPEDLTREKLAQTSAMAKRWGALHRPPKSSPGLQAVRVGKKTSQSQGNRDDVNV